MEAVDAATFVDNVVIESLTFCFLCCKSLGLFRIMYTWHVRTAVRARTRGACIVLPMIYEHTQDPRFRLNVGDTAVFLLTNYDQVSMICGIYAV